MFRNRAVYFLAGLMLILNFALMFFLWSSKGQKGPKHHRKGENMSLYFKKELNLNEEQFQVLQETRERFNTNLKTIGHGIRDTRDQIHAAIAQEPPDSVLSNQLANDLGKYIMEEEKFLVQHYLDIYEICDDSQKELLPKVFLNTLGGKNKRKGRRPPPPSHH